MGHEGREGKALTDEWYAVRNEGEAMHLIVFSGLPGSGKSSVAESIGQELGIPVFATRGA
jgi:adenylylsulfate kinase-like enzyme